MPDERTEATERTEASVSTETTVSIEESEIDVTADQSTPDRELDSPASGRAGRCGPE